MPFNRNILVLGRRSHGGCEWKGAGARQDPPSAAGARALTRKAGTASFREFEAETIRSEAANSSRLLRGTGEPRKPRFWDGGTLALPRRASRSRKADRRSSGPCAKGVSAARRRQLRARVVGGLLVQIDQRMPPEDMRAGGGRMPTRSSAHLAHEDVTHRVACAQPKVRSVQAVVPSRSYTCPRLWLRVATSMSSMSRRWLSSRPSAGSGRERRAERDPETGHHSALDLERSSRIGGKPGLGASRGVSGPSPRVLVLVL